ncbi:MAG: hypothetical protein MUE74_10830, partial [Bacteroidales bacterium]|nr:hypothetical protein [Bacteroidales bacterium]
GPDEIQTFLSNHIPVDNQNWEMSQDPVTGYLYFANSVGLIEYNGISTRRFSMPFGQGIRSVMVSSRGLIFTGAFEEFGYWEKDPDRNLTYNSLAQLTEVPKNDEIWNIYEKGGSIFFQSFTSIYRYDTSGVARIPGPSIMLFMFPAGQRFIVQGIGTGLYWFNGNGFEFIPGSEIFRNLKIHALICRKTDEYWICTANNGIYAFDGISITKQESEVSSYLEDYSCNAGLALNDSLIAFGTILKGIVFCDESGRIQSIYDYSNGLNNNTVLSLFLDRSEGLWIGMDDGANYINVYSPITLFADFSGTLGTIYSAVREDSRLYLGTNHGLFAADIKHERGDYSFPNLRMIPGSQGQVWTLQKFNEQILCGHNDGTFLLENESLVKISDVTGGWSLKQYNDILLEGTYTGIISFALDGKGKWKYRKRLQGYIEPSRSIEVDYLGFVWATHPQKGIYRLELNEAVDSVVSVLYFSSVGDSSNKVSVSRINNQVVFLTSEKIYSFDYENKTFIPVRSIEQGLGEYAGSGQIIPCQKNSYWFVLGTRTALFDISRELDARKILEFSHRFDALPSREQQIIELDDKTILIPSRKAFITVNTGRLGSSVQPGVSIDHLVFSGRSGSRIIIPGDREKIAVPKRFNNLAVFLADPSGFDLENKEYLYRIGEIDESWRKTSEGNFSFLNLGFGHFSIQLKNAAGGEISETGFLIKRPGWLSWGALAAYVVILALLVLAGIGIFRRELSRHRQLIEYELGKNRLESELDSKSSELMLTMRYLIEKNEIMTELNSHVTELKSQPARYPQKIVREMEKIISSGLNSQTEEWKNAMNSLKLSQQGFFKKMLDKYPHLTPNDLRLCSYLRMNFTTKEIAKLLNISSRAVEISRYRLRRKLSLDHDVNLTEFLIRESEGEAG